MSAAKGRRPLEQPTTSAESRTINVHKSGRVSVPAERLHMWARYLSVHAADVDRLVAAFHDDGDEDPVWLQWWVERNKKIAGLASMLSDYAMAAELRACEVDMTMPPGYPIHGHRPCPSLEGE